ncbi:MAG: hypothetical protein AAB373_03280 [Patescibacteria group bacterium]
MNSYLLLITLGMVSAYFMLFFLLPYFFEKPVPKLKLKSLYSVIFIIIFSLFVYEFTDRMANHELGNRILHAVAGGFLAFVTCFLAARDGQLKITGFQFFFFSLLLVIAFGVANEFLEAYLQNHTTIIFAPNVNDTWFDLISNFVGAIIAAGILMPLFKRRM